MTFETFDQSDEETWPDQKKHNDKDKYKDKDNDKDKYILRTQSKSDPRALWPLRHLIRVMRRYDLTIKKTMTKTPAMSDPRDLWPLEIVTPREN